MKKYMLIFVILFSTSCSFSSRRIETNFDRPNLDLPKIEKLNLDDVKMEVLTKDEVEQYDSEVLFVISDNDYKKLSLNMQKILSHIRIQNKVIQLYKDYYEAENGKEKN